MSTHPGAYKRFKVQTIFQAEGPTSPFALPRCSAGDYTVSQVPHVLYSSN